MTSAVENLYLQSFSTNSGLLTPDNALGNGIGTWTTNADSASWSAIGEFQNPVQTTAVDDGGGPHTFQARVRKEAGTGNPTFRMEVLDLANNVIGDSGTVTITSTGNQDIFVSVLPATLNSASGELSDIKVRLTGTTSGGSPSVRSVPQVDFVTWFGKFDTVSIGASMYVFNSGTELNADIYVWDGSLEIPISSLDVT